MTKEWRVVWKDGWLVDSTGNPRGPVLLEIPEYRIAHELVDRWGSDLDLPSRLPQIGDWPFWWSLRFELQRSLARAVPQLRLLRQIREEMGELPRRIVLEHPPDPWWPVLFALEFPGAVTGTIQEPQPRGLSRKVGEGQVLLRRAWRSFRRVREIASGTSSRPRVAVLSPDRMWNGTEDVELRSVLSALTAGGLEPVVFSRAWGSVEHRQLSLDTRPSDHLFVDEILFRHVLRRGFPRIPSIDLPPGGFEFEGRDLRPLVQHLLMRGSRQLYRQRVAYSRTFPDILGALGIRAGILTDENAGNHGLKMGFARAGIPTAAVQHGVIHADHLSYMFPPGTPSDSIPLCEATCVRGPWVQRLLTERSCYREEQVTVTGPLERDQRTVTDSELAEIARALRERTLPQGCNRLLFFTSQTEFRNSVAPKLLEAFARSRPEGFLVIRPHPLEGPPEFWARAVAERGLGRRVRIDAEGTVEEWLAACDVHLSVSSTVLGEAAALDRPSVTVSSRSAGDFCACLEAGVAVELDDFPSLDAALDHWLAASPPESDRHRAHRRKYTEEHFHLPDGKAAERVAGVVTGLLSRKS